MNVNINARYLFGIGMVLAVLMVFAAPAAAENKAYFVPQHGNATIGNFTYMTLYVDIKDGQRLAGGQVELIFDAAHADITKWYKNCITTDNQCWGALDTNFDFTDNGYMWGGCSDPQYHDGVEWTSITEGYFTGPATVKIGMYRIYATGTPGESPFNFGFEMEPSGCNLCQPSKFVDELGVPLNITWVNGTFTHLAGASDPFTKFLPEGWNLISLPLTPTNTSVDSVLSSVSQNAVKRYDATTKTFETATTMDTGTGYFVHVTNPSGSTWTYDGWPVTSTSPGLESGLNMIGVPNCTMDVGTAMGTADYRYVARWNAVDQKYEVYNPSAPDAFWGFTTMSAGEGYFVSATTGNSSFAISCPS